MNTLLQRSKSQLTICPRKGHLPRLKKCTATSEVQMPMRNGIQIDYNQSLQLTLSQIKSDSQKAMSDVGSTGDLHWLRLDELQVAWTERASSWLDTCTIRLHCLDELRLSSFRLFEQSVCYRPTSNNTLSQICIKSQIRTFHYSEVDDLLNEHTAMSQKCAIRKYNNL